MTRSVRRSIFSECSLLLALSTGCDGDGGSDAPEPSIEFLSPGTEDAMPAGAGIDVMLRSQGVFGAQADIRIVGVLKDSIGNFSIAVTSPAGHELARQAFLPTSTARELADGSVVIAELPIVFFDDVAADEVRHAAATLSAEMTPMDAAPMGPPVAGALEVVLELAE